MLTDKQQKALIYIAEKTQNGSAPTLREICDFMGYKAVGSAQDVIAALRKKGFLDQPDKQAARSLSLTERAHELLSSVIPTFSSELANTLVVPCLGEVPAGDPIEAIENAVGTLKFDGSSLPRGMSIYDQLFAVQARGESMLGAGIMDGDWLVVKSDNEAQVGQIVIARFDGDVTVKRLERDTRGYFLKPENELFNPIYAEDQDFEVIGRVIALQRILSF